MQYHFHVHYFHVHSQVVSFLDEWSGACELHEPAKVERLKKHALAATKRNIARSRRLRNRSRDKSPSPSRRPLAAPAPATYTSASNSTSTSTSASAGRLKSALKQTRSRSLSDLSSFIAPGAGTSATIAAPGQMNTGSGGQPDPYPRQPPGTVRDGVHKAPLYIRQSSNPAASLALRPSWTQQSAGRQMLSTDHFREPELYYSTPPRGQSQLADVPVAPASAPLERPIPRLSLVRPVSLFQADERLTLHNYQQPPAPAPPHHMAQSYVSECTSPQSQSQRSLSTAIGLELEDVDTPCVSLDATSIGRTYPIPVQTSLPTPMAMPVPCSTASYAPLLQQQQQQHFSFNQFTGAPSPPSPYKSLPTSYSADQITAAAGAVNAEEQAIDELVDQLWAPMTPATATATPSRPPSASMTRRSSVSGPTTNGTLTLAGQTPHAGHANSNGLPQSSSLELVNERLGRLGLVQPVPPPQSQPAAYSYSNGSPGRDRDYINSSGPGPRAPGILAFSKYTCSTANASSNGNGTGTALQGPAQPAAVSLPNGYNGYFHHRVGDFCPNGYPSPVLPAAVAVNKRGRTPPPPPPARGMQLAKTAPLVTAPSIGLPNYNGIAVAAVARGPPFVRPLAADSATSSVSSPASIDSGLAIPPSGNGNSTSGPPLSGRSQASKSHSLSHQTGSFGFGANGVIGAPPAVAAERSRRDDELHELLSALGLQQYAPLLEQHALDVHTLRLASDEQLERIGLPLGACIRLTTALGARGDAAAARLNECSTRERPRSPRLVPAFSASPAPDLQC